VPYGFGWFLGDDRGYRVTEHGGSSGTDLLRLPDKRLTVIVLTNLGVPVFVREVRGADAEAIARAVVGLYDPALLAPQMLTPKLDPNPALTRQLFGALREMANGTESPLVVPALLAWIHDHESADSLHRFAGLLQGARFEFLGHDVPHHALRYFGADIAGIYYYRMVTDRGTFVRTFWLTHDQKIANTFQTRE